MALNLSPFIVCFLILFIIVAVAGQQVFLFKSNIVENSKTAEFRDMNILYYIIVGFCILVVTSCSAGIAYSTQSQNTI